jgi:hypothetical protein
MATRRLASLMILSLALGSWSCAPATMTAQSASGCRPNDNNKVPARLVYFKGLLADTDTTSVNFRSAFQLQQVAVNKVSLSYQGLDVRQRGNGGQHRPRHPRRHSTGVGVRVGYQLCGRGPDHLRTCGGGHPDLPV